jgi:hypothetical protein
MTSAGYLLEAASAVVADAVGDREANIEPVPDVLRFVTVEVVCRAMANPAGLSSESEQLGEYSHTSRFRDGTSGGGLWLTDLERLMVRGAVHGRLSGTALQQSMASDPCVLREVAPASYAWPYGDGPCDDCEGS